MRSPLDRNPNYTYFDSTRRPEPGTEYQNNMNRYPMGPYDPNGQQFPDWVDPNSGYKIEYNVDGQPYYAWYPNGEYQGGNPFIDGDAFMERAMYPRYTADRLPDPNWRPAYPGQRPPWMNAPESDWVPPPTKEYLEQTRQKDAERKAAADQQYESDRMQRQQAQEAGAIFVRDNKKQRWGVYYPPGYKGPKVNIDKSRTPDRGGITEIGDPRQLGEEGKDWQVYNLQGGYRQWDNQPTMSFSQASQRQPSQGAPAPGAPAPGAPAPGAPAAAPAPQMSWEELEASRRAEWEAGGRKGTEYFDKYGNYHSDGFSSGPKQTQAEQQYWAEQRKTNPMVARAMMFDAGDWHGWDMYNSMKVVKGPNGAERMMWNPDRQSNIDQSFTPEQRAAAEVKMNAFNQQFDPNNIAGNPAYAKEAEFQQMERFHKNFDPNGTPYQRAQYAKYQQMLAERQGGGQQPPAPAPKPGPMPAPKSMGAPAQGAPVANPAVANMGDARFANGNPYYNRKGNLRMPFQNAIAREMVSGMGGNDSGTSYNMGGQNGQALFGTQNNYGYWPQGQQQNGMAKQANPYGASPQQAMNFYGGYGY